MYQTFFAPNLLPYREDWTNLSDDVCYIGPEPEAQEHAGSHEKGRQMEEGKKSVVERTAHASPDACARVCEAAGLDFTPEEYEVLATDEERSEFLRQKYEEKSSSGDINFLKKRSCFQWRLHKGACCISRSFKLGYPKKESDKFTSGWFVPGIENWINSQDQCDGPAWREPS